jgi:NAD+ synthase (glutamine-hydrolysing)
LDEKGQLIVRGNQFQEDLTIADLNVESVFRTRLHDPRWRKESLPREGKGWRNTRGIVVSEAPFNTEKTSLPSRRIEERGLPAEIYDALVLGTRDYVLKNGFDKVLI